MKPVNFDLNNIYKYLIFFILLYISIIINLVYGEDSTGGAFVDYINQKKISQDFAINFKNTFFNYDQYTTRHSPVLIIFLSFFEKINLADHFIRLIHLHLCLLLPIIFFSCLRIKYKFVNPENLLLLVGLIFLSPTFRSLAIWPDSRLLGLTLFCFSIYFYLMFEENKKFKNCIFNIIFCAISAYISPNFALFSIFYFYKFIIFFKLEINKLIPIILLNLILSVPAFYYIFALDINFLTTAAVLNVEGDTNIFFSNIFNKILIISSITLFYLFPFLITRIISLNKTIKFNAIIIALTIFLISMFYFNYTYQLTGGGIIFKFSNFFLNNNILFFIVCFVSILIITNLSNLKFQNFLLFLLILLSNPQITIYHKYYDPFLLIIFFTLFNFNINLSKINLKLNSSIIYLFFISFLIISNYKYLWKI
jgi:hypothetical protein